MATQTVNSWLKTLKLEQYAGVFKDEGVDDMDCVALLTENYLQQMGITKIGHKLRLMNAISKLKQQQQIQKQSVNVQPNPQPRIAPIINRQTFEQPNIQPAAPTNNKRSLMFEQIEKCHQNMDDKIHSKSKFKQHWKLEKIFPIPTDTKKSKRKTFQKIEVIKTMQNQYKTEDKKKPYKRLDKILKKVLDEEFQMRLDILQINHKIKKDFHKLSETMNSEMNTNASLQKIMALNQRNKQRERNMIQTQKQLHNSYQSSRNLQFELQKSLKKLENYVIYQRQLVHDVNGVLYASINQKYQQIMDATVTNYFIREITNIRHIYKTLHDTYSKYEIHINSILYIKKFGTVEEREKAMKCNNNTNDDNNKMYKLYGTNISILFGRKIKGPDCLKISHANKKDVVATIAQIKQQHNLELSAKVIKYNNICLKWLNGMCGNDDDDDLCEGLHKIPNEILETKNNNKVPKPQINESNPKSKRKKSIDSWFISPKPKNNLKRKSQIMSPSPTIIRVWKPFA